MPLDPYPTPAEIDLAISRLSTILEPELAHDLVIHFTGPNATDSSYEGVIDFLTDALRDMTDIDTDPTVDDNDLVNQMLLDIASQIWSDIASDILHYF